MATSRSTQNRQLSLVTYLIVTGLSCMFLTSNAFAAIAMSDFETDADGWTGLACINPGICALGSASLGSKFTHEAANGNPGGWIAAVDPDSANAARFIAPSKFKDNLNIDISDIAANRRVLSFDAIAIDTDGTGVFDSPIAPVVVIEGVGAQALVYSAPVPVEGIWTNFIVPLYKEAGDSSVNEGWDLLTATGDINNPFAQTDATEADFLNFGTISRLSLIGEWLNDSADADIGGLDNVQLSAVPVPAALPLLLSALGALGFGLRKK